MDRAERRRNSWFKGPAVGAGKVAGQAKCCRPGVWLGWKQRPGCIAPGAKSD